MSVFLNVCARFARKVKAVKRGLKKINTGHHQQLRFIPNITITMPRLEAIISAEDKIRDEKALKELKEIVASGKDFSMEELGEKYDIPWGMVYYNPYHTMNDKQEEKLVLEPELTISGMECLLNYIKNKIDARIMVSREEVIDKANEILQDRKNNELKIDEEWYDKFMDTHKEFDYYKVIVLRKVKMESIDCVILDEVDFELGIMPPSPSKENDELKDKITNVAKKKLNEKKIVATTRKTRSSSQKSKPGRVTKKKK